MTAIDEETLQGHAGGGVEAAELSRHALFEHLPPDTTAALACQARWCHYAPGDVVVRPGVDEQRVLVVHSGSVRVEAVALNKEYIVRSLGRGQVIDMPPVPGRLADLTLVRAEPDGAVIVALDRAGFVAAVLSQADSAREWVEQLSDWTYALGTLFTDHVFETAKTCFARALGRRAKDTPDGVVHLTRAELGALAGISESQATTFLHELRKDGLVDFKNYEHCRVEVLNTDSPLDEWTANLTKVQL